MVWLLFHKVVQSCDIWPYMSMISPMLHLLWRGKLFAPHKLSYYAWRKGQIFCRFALRGWCEVIIEGLCELNSILPLLVARSTNRPGTGSYCKYGRNLKWLLLGTIGEMMWVLLVLHMDANNWNTWKYKIVHLGNQTLLLQWW